MDDLLEEALSLSTEGTVTNQLTPKTTYIYAAT